MCIRDSPLSIHLAKLLSEQFDGKLRISYSGGATIYNIREMFDAGIWPITMATNILKPGGYEDVYKRQSYGSAWRFRNTR